MPNIKLYTSNQMEILADQLAEILDKPLSSPLKPEVIVVQSRGMERWISMQLADRHGIWSNCNYFFPNQIVEEIFKYIIPEASQGRIFDTDIISWQIMKILPQCILQEGFESLAYYMSGEDAYFRRYQLSSRIADTFDQYLTFRPGMILEWDQGKGDDWQGKLWCLLMDELKLLHPPALRKKFFERIKEPENIDRDSLPERISVFGISSIPVYHLDVLAAISDYIDVNIFFMNPSKEYWADIHSEKNIAMMLGAYESKSTIEELHLEKGNSLLASMGRLGSDFLFNIMKYAYVQEFQDFKDPGQDSLLHAIQYDILNMIDRIELDPKNSIFSLDQIRSDSSIRIHSCHSPLREVEVLYDNLLDMFNSDSLEPKDIIVMMPDIELYSPYISAIFESQEEDYRIPYSIADTSIRKDSRIDTFFAVLDLEQSRFESGRVLDILEREQVMGKFDLTVHDISVIRRWVKDTNINWGIDSEDRARLGLPGFKENTWEAGIKQLLLGYAMPANEEMMYGDVLPYDIEGSESSVLGKFIGYFNSLKSLVRSISKPRKLSEWNQILKRILDELLEPGDLENDALMDVVNKLYEIEERSDFHEEVELKVTREWMENLLKERRIRSGFLTGGVTFCAMLPMRSIPFKVICLIGMNDATFPKVNRSVSFDLIAKNPVRGDRSQRNDDRYLFLESIISARKRFYISYTGQGIQDNSEIPPSVVVSELLDYIEAYSTDDADIKDYILVRHPLQAFSPRYFGNDENLFTYSDSLYRAGMSAVSDRQEAGIFIKGKVSDPYVHDGTIQLSDFINFFIYPAKHILVKRLGIYLDEKADVIDENEPFDIMGLEKYRLEDIICEHFISDRDIENLLKINRARGLLPFGAIGDYAFNNLLSGIKDFSYKVKELTAGRKFGPLEVNLDIFGYILSGIIDNIWPDGMIHYRYARTKVKDRVRSWITHLALNASHSKSYPLKTILICRDESWCMEPVDSSMNLLEELIQIYLKGMNELIYFFPETSLEYAKRFLEKGSHDKAKIHAESIWAGDDFKEGEGRDSYNYLCFGNINPFGRDFTEISLKVFEPMLNYQKKVDT